jgi:hypothetical protein
MKKIKTTGTYEEIDTTDMKKNTTGTYEKIETTGSYGKKDDRNI